MELQYYIFQFFTSTLLLSKMNVNAIFYECNLPFSLQKFSSHVINKLWYDMVNSWASFLKYQLDTKVLWIQFSNSKFLIFAYIVHERLLHLHEFNWCFMAVLNLRWVKNWWKFVIKTMFSNCTNKDPARI